ncbi:unnamed protein product [Callosobruchus maculatus]|uniref:C2H2-type domain-containing protein n=1 Tax=Callosobruchus maculatus TaxID=64391 RepID=A0A653DLP2_CALMS|nr:unnamed protein product [Callosobruchus maculatus]
MNMYSAMFCHSIFAQDDPNETEIKREDIRSDLQDPYPYTPNNIPSESYSVPLKEKPTEEPRNEPKIAKQQKCNICGKVLSSASSYYVHLKQHSDNKPYQCSHCEASFCRKPYLEVHMRTHTGERPFECEICKKRFTQKSSLNTHKRSHTGLRPYACPVCLKRFSVKSYLNAHQWIHAADNGIRCATCHMTFNNKSQYLEHLRSHSTKGYDCEFCSRAFSKESYLIRHRIRVHSKVLQNQPK